MPRAKTIPTFLESIFIEVAEVGIHYRRKPMNDDPKKITCSLDARNLFLPFMDDHLDHYEAFYVMALDNSNTVLNIFKASIGGITGTVADIRLIFQHLILTNATACIIAHNHPSGKCIPSTADLSLTRKIKSAGEILDIKLFDHVIVTRHSHYSFADEGVL